MFSGFFNYDNPVWRFVGKFFDIMLLNVLWFVCSIPIVTIGASTTAVYYVTLKLARDEEGATIASFFKSFKENFKQSTIIWLLMLVAGIIIGFDLYIFLVLRTESSIFRTVMLSIFGGVGIAFLYVGTFVFPLQSRFYNPIKRTLFNAFFMSVRHFLQTLSIIVISIGIPALALLFIPMLQPVLFLFGFPMIAFFNSYIFNNIFKKYMPETEDEADRELRPLFSDEEEDEDR